MPKLRNPGLYSFLVFLAACALVAFLYVAKAPEAGKLAGELIALVVASFGARSALESRDARKNTGSNRPHKPRTPTWPDAGFVLRELLFVLGVVLLVAWLIVHVVSCAGLPSASSTRRETVRAAAVTAAEAVRVLDAACADVVRASGDRAMGERCDAVYVPARASLIKVGLAVDGWETADKGSVTCAIVAATRELPALAHELAPRTRARLEVVDDAAALARALGPCTTGGDR